MISNSQRKKKKGSDVVEIPDKSSTSPLSLRDIFNHEPSPIQKISHEDSSMSSSTVYKKVEKQPEASHRLPNKSQQQSTKIRKKSILSELSKGGFNIPSTSILRSKDFSNSSSSNKSRITDFLSSSQFTEMMSVKRKKSDELGSNELLTKRVKLNVNIQSILEKVLDEQLKQRIAIDNLQKSNEELRQEISENHKLLQNIFTILTSKSTIITEKAQRGGLKQRLKRKDTKYMWWDVNSNDEACHQLFQVNKNPSDTEVEQAFRSQIQADLPQKIQELVN
ncbi:3748_t:CDS:2 [Funneliformis caledonium]|uniref:3748_t:CDS:1 n=1 Tax=Funneliformis caledonium TaxID=1117310 RepID=A0A9N9GRA6_9GLOM|nr:3748_t:CDS:2 [Funneliformis caledonium]